jgi:hypothetical protein
LNRERASLLSNSKTSRAYLGGLGGALLLLGLITEIGFAQKRPAQAPADNGLRSELSLDSHTASVSIKPLRADDPAHRSLFSSGAAGARISIGQLQTNGTLRLGTLSFAKNDLRGLKYDLWLQGTRAGWQLGVVELPPPPMPPGAEPKPAAEGRGGEARAGSDSKPAADKPAAEPKPPTEPKPLGEIALTPHASTGSTPALIAALIPTSADSGRLVLRWGALEASTDLHFTEPFKQPLGGGGPPNQPINRKHDDDLTAVSRVLMLTQRNETVVVVPKGSRLAISYARTLPKGERSAAGAAAGVTANSGLSVEGPDFAALMSTPDGAVVQLTQAAVPRLVIETPIRLGKAQLRTGNQAPGLPGTYGLWLKRAGRGWRLVFSQEPDTWGSQYDQKSDVTEIDLAYSKGADALRPFTVGLVPTTNDRGRLMISWGPHEWTADYIVGG